MTHNVATTHALFPADTEGGTKDAIDWEHRKQYKRMNDGSVNWLDPLSVGTTFVSLFT